MSDGIMGFPDLEETHALLIIDLVIPPLFNDALYLVSLCSRVGRGEHGKRHTEPWLYEDATSVPGM